ncbi:DNA alkylation repair protein [Sabulilitoribacter multivorans]|uniref:DNA alkylation repair protein n=1 Tax=Flaviramulus multivorans TaxID=1304750 RepID=A0ABS9IFI5_9FLAO|nr:DNA alkylation repair protein [Flaviramulus multivorans]MCF7559293.1 DNA alkylation repair protein [Flaviramulus multivorans]
MELSSKAQKIYSAIDKETTKLGDLRKIAIEIKKDHALAMELWSTKEFLPRQLAILIMDKKLLNQEVIDQLDNDIQKHEFDERNNLMDWLMANQLSKDKKIISLIESWENSPSKLQRRVFWYYQARLRWMGNTNQTNTEELLDLIEKNLMKEEPEVQWAMNYTAGQIGKWQEQYRDRCILIGEETGLYKDEMVAKNCVPSYLPKFIPIEVAKLKK